MIWLLVVLLAGVVAVLAFLLFKQRAAAPAPAKEPVDAIPASAPAQAKPGPNKGQFWGKQFIVIEPEKVCPEARELHGHCFAYGKVPAVPLQGCASASCTCHFRDLDERRSGKERREDVRFEDKHDRRSGKDRRNSEGRYDWRFTA